MDPPERLSGDQRAVLALVLRQGRSYGQIAAILSIEPEQVRARTLAAIDALGPPTTLADADRGQIVDYLLGQLPADDADAVREQLSGSPDKRAWARVVRGELTPLASDPLPELPGEVSDRPAATAPTDAGAGTAQPTGPRSSRTGGIVLLSLLAAAIIAAIVIFVVKPGGGTHKHHNRAVARASAGGSSTTSSTSTTSTSTTASQSASIVGEISLAPPDGNSKVSGLAYVARQGSLKGIVIEAKNVPPTTTKPRTAYAAWLYNSSSDAKLLGYFRQAVTKKGDLGSTAELPANAAHYRLLIITLETGAKPGGTPGPVVLEGKLADVPKSKL